ncbi:Uncharacterised protein [Vibrio cholerae]|nr:Uncharacterised protein [Vibrio cholerae]
MRSLSTNTTLQDSLLLCCGFGWAATILLNKSPCLVAALVICLLCLL